MAVASGLLLAASLAVTRQVSPDGAPGTFPTISSCVDASGSGDVCAVGAGTYKEEVAFSDKGVSIVGLDRGKVVLDGTEALPDNWSLYKGNVYKTQLTDLMGFDVKQVFVDGSYAPEARWPNANLDDMLDVSAWATTDNGTTLGKVVDADLAKAAPGVDWNGAIVTLNSDLRILSYTRTVQDYNETESSFTYQLPLPGSILRDPSRYIGSLYVISGVLAALDSPGEWWLDRSTSELYIWMPDSKAPGSRVSVKARDLCVQGTQATGGDPIAVQNMTFHGCTLSLYNCVGCTMQDLVLEYPSFIRTIDFLNPSPGSMPNITLLQGNDSVIDRVSLKNSNHGGILVMGWRNRVEDTLVMSTDWFGTLDFPPIQIGFGPSNCGHGVYDEELGLRPTRLGHCGHWLADVPSVPDHLRKDLRQVMGTDNVVTRVTVKGFGNAGIVTTQLSCEVSYAHVSSGGLIGCDHAGIHVDNLPTPCMYDTTKSNCTKSFHHNWVHDCREKCLRGDDATVNMTAHTNVIWNCGYPKRDAACGRASSGLVFKGDYNVGYDNTIFNVTFEDPGFAAHGELVVFTNNGPPPPSCRGDECVPMNHHSIFVNNAARVVNPMGGPALNESAVFDGGLYSGSYESLQLADPLAFNFAPLSGSPLRRTGVVHPPQTTNGSGGTHPNIGAVQDNVPAWRPGCTAFPEC
eukprot:TRINITY_DN22430_c0_g2_i2.p1 TRINITY_DN22430_c0_g2~~TRINITY_DN22430_c0_g2_i2.p1  ORF type:complete len:687 (+),score=171.26 TRINITY_DN22430_c0_g2_i2:62-2122(+)